MTGGSGPGAGGSGHRGVPHTADLRIEAWAPTGGCLAGRKGMVGSFADVSPSGRRAPPCWRCPGLDDDLLVAVLDG